MKKLLKERYEVLEKLGIGGMGVVYKGKDTLLDRLVAIKMIPPHIQDEDIVRRFITEAHALARLNHPYIVRYYEMGEEDGQYYLIMEYVDGKNIKEAVSSLSDPLQQMTKFTRQVCEALDYAHLQGIIHRDVKPGNLLVDFTENIKVMDFGLARILLEGTRITASGSILGTAAYMAPEQTLSSNVDFRADLYSLGVTLFELSTGRLPFEGNDPVAIIMQHCSEPPPLPRSLNSRIPVSLEKIILKLLAKSPAERFPSAIALKEALERIDWKETSACEPAIFSSSYCRMAGREKELNYLRNLLDQTLQRKSKFVFIDGELGIGKSRILHRLYSYAALQGFKTAVGICTYPSELYQPFLQIFESMGLQTSLFAPMEDEQERTFSSIVEHLKPVMSREPLAFFLEDINQADEGSLQFLKYLTKNLEGLPFFLFGTLDTRETVPVFQKFWLDMNDCAETEVMTLEGLSSFETEEIVKAFLNVNSLPEELNIQIFQNSGGNPLYIREILNSLIEDKILAKDGERLIFTPLMELKVPHSLKDIIEKRIKSLDSEVLNLLSTASVLGSRFDFEILLEILQMQEDKLLDLLKKCVEEQILKEEWGKGKDEYVFSNHLFREVFYRNMSPRRRKNFHQKAGEILEKICAGNSSEYCNALAYHFFLSENLEKAIYYGTLAGEKAMKYFSYQEAGDYWNKVLTLM
ncbi:MAG: protein kinase, partial [Firmicutes bacterium]|nr:protein kinase [Bacillota bacterium]